jgi:hypothetical protein
MENEIITNRSWKKLILLILIIIISVFIIYYTIMSMMAPSRKLTEIRNEYGLKPTEKKVVDERIFYDSVYVKLLKDKAFLQSRIAMAESDSIYLTLNISDSTANIEISGVAVHTAKMSEIKVSKIVMEDNDNIILSILAKPFIISESVATIMKEPVMVKIAPKDTSEYVPDIMPDTSLTEPVSIILDMSNGTRVYICQEETDKGDRMALFTFDLIDRIKTIKANMKNVLHFKVPEYHPFIKIKLPRADAKIIYRGIPKNGQIAVFR